MYSTGYGVSEIMLTITQCGILCTICDQITSCSKESTQCTMHVHVWSKDLWCLTFVAWANHGNNEKFQSTVCYTYPWWRTYTWHTQVPGRHWCVAYTGVWHTLVCGIHTHTLVCGIHWCVAYTGVWHTLVCGIHTHTLVCGIHWCDIVLYMHNWIISTSPEIWWGK